MIVLPLIRFILFIMVVSTVLARAYTHRLALFIGNNKGLVSERPLKYAARDARHMASAFIDEGSMERDRVYLLENRSLEKIRATVQEMRGRAIELRKRWGKVMVLIYYSGHGGSNALHIRGAKLTREELSRYVDELSADLKLLIIDACESGDLLRSKGGEVITDYRVESEDKLSNKGTVILTSSSQGELAQESERYKGAVFTHHLLNGLRGVADYNNDQNISLWEVYNYASVSTRSENVLRGIRKQNPSFDFDVVGKKDVVLTTLRKKQAGIVLKNMPQTSLEIHDGASMELKAKLLLTGRDSVVYRLPSKEYLLTYERGDVFNVARADLSYGRTINLSPASFKQISKADVYHKGGKVLSLNPRATRVGFSNVTIGDIAVVPTITTSYEIRTYRFHHSLGAGWGRESKRGDLRDVDYSLISLSYSTRKPFFRYRFGQLLVGGKVSAYRLWQDFTDTRFENTPNPDKKRFPNKYTKYTTFFEAGVPLEKELYLPWGFLISAAIQPSLYYSKNMDGEWGASLDLSPAFAFGIKF